MWFKRLLYVLIGLVGLLALLYLIQPLKKGDTKPTSTYYELVENWPQLPANVKLGNPTGIGIDTNQHLVVFHRASQEWPLFGGLPNRFIPEKTILIIDPTSGKLLESWGSNLFVMPHGLTVDHQNNIWVTDVGLHQVFKFTHNGKLLMKLGKAAISGSDSVHFDKPTDVAVAQNGSFFVSDGYGNSRVIKFSPSGKYLFEWGIKGTKTGAFHIPHGLALDAQNQVYVADRENNRIQVFDSTGRFLKQITDEGFGSVCSVAFDKNRKKLFAIDDLSFLKIKHRGSNVFVFDTSGKIETRFGRSSNQPAGWYHDLAVDNQENSYVGDILNNRVLKFRRITSPNSVP
ncbi:MAG: peptidyl-alpha-hydroxyglycine alpha-amidating lyase family protein [Spirosomataceae bacterium]